MTLDGEAMLFPTLLGERFETLPPSVRVLHTRAGRQQRHGEVEVVRGRGWLSRLCAWATRLPPAQAAGAIRVEIDADPTRERWTRHVGAHAMRSKLWRRDGLLRERLGLATFAFHLDVEDAAIVWRVAEVRVFGLSLPARWFEGVCAREFEQHGRYCFDVAATLPWVGPLVHYRGWLQTEVAATPSSDDGPLSKSPRRQ